MAAQIQFDSDTGNAGLRVGITSELDGQVTELVFDSFPIRIGRNRNNDLVLFHEYVSQWHAVVGFVRGELSIMQVGSSNSVRVNGRKMRPNELVPLRGGEEIRIVPFGLNMQLTNMPPLQAPGPPPDQPPYDPAPPQPRPHHPVQTPGWDPALAPGQTMTTAPPAGDAALAVLNRLAQKYQGRYLNDSQEVAIMGARLERTLDVLLGFFMELHHGQRNFYEELAIPPPDSSGKLLDPLADGAQLGALMLALVDRGGIQAVEEAIGTIKLHQVSLFRGLEAGVRSLVRRLSPKAVNRAASAGGGRQPGPKALWQAYLDRHGDYAEDQSVFKVVWGAQFRKAYTRVMQEGKQAKAGHQR